MKETTQTSSTLFPQKYFVLGVSTSFRWKISKPLNQNFEFLQKKFVKLKWDFFRLFSRSNFHSKSVSRTCWDTWYVIIKNSGIEKTFLVSHPPCSSKSQKWYPIIHVVFFVQINLICFIIWFRRRFHRNSCKWPLDHLFGSKRIAGGDLIPNAYFYAFWIFPHVLVWLDSLKKRAAVLPLLMMMAFSAIRDDEEAMHFVLFFALVID